MAISTTERVAGVSAAARPKGTLRIEIGMPIAIVALYIALIPPTIDSMALKISEVSPNHSAGSLSLVLGVGAIFAMVGNPIAGRLSDRTGGRLGMRRPWMIAGALVGFVALVVIATSGSVAQVLIGWCLAQIGFNSALAALLATMADKVRPQYRGRVAAAVGVAQNGTVVLGTFLVQLFHTTTLQLLIPGAIGVGAFLVYCAIFKDTTRPEGKLPAFGVKEFAGSFYFNPRKHPDFGWAWLTRFLMTTAANTATSYLTYFLIQDHGVSKEAVATKVFNTTLFYVIGIVASTFFVGAISDRLQRRKIFVLVASLVGVIGLLTIAFSPSLGGVYAGELIMGAGIGSFFAVDLALINDVIPHDGNNARDLGVVNIASALPQSIVPAGAPLAIAAFGGYPGLFVSGAVLGVLGSLSVLRVKGVR